MNSVTLKSPKRFIAGARCPSCELFDKIQCWWEGKSYHSECVSCGYKEVMDNESKQGGVVQVLNLPDD